MSACISSVPSLQAGAFNGIFDGTCACKAKHSVRAAKRIMIFFSMISSPFNPDVVKYKKLFGREINRIQLTGFHELYLIAFFIF